MFDMREDNRYFSHIRELIYFGACQQLCEQQQYNFVNSFLSTAIKLNSLVTRLRYVRPHRLQIGWQGLYALS